MNGHAFRYACVACVTEVGGRCRNHEKWGKTFCAGHEHAVDRQITEAPDVLLVRFNHNERIAERARDASIPMVSDRVPWVVREAWREKRATETRRKFHRYRPQRGDNGTLVFDPKLPAASLASLIADLLRGGYVLASIDIKPKVRHDKVVGYVTTFAYGKKEAVENPVQMTSNQERFLNYLLSAPWDVFAYANPFDERKGYPLDTVNAGSPRFGEDPLFLTRWNGGLFAAEAIS